MLMTAIVLFALGAVGGLAMFAMHLKGRDIPLGVAIVHGLLGASGLIVLVLAVVRGLTSGNIVTTALVLFVVAALGGFVLFAGHLRGKPLSTPLIVIHALVAVGGFGALLYTAFGS